LIAVGFEVIHYEDVAKDFGEGNWGKANDILEIIDAEGRENCSALELEYWDKFAYAQPRMLNDLRHLSSE
jgi:hypothetical protein